MRLRCGSPYSLDYLMAISRIAIIEDDAPFARSFEEHFNRNRSDIRCIAVYSSAEEAIIKIESDPPDIAMVDINLPGMNGIECIMRLKSICPSTICLVLTTFDNNSMIFDALKAGACGYLLKRTAPADIAGAIREALAGGSPMSPNVARQVVSFFHRTPTPRNQSALTDREREVIDLLARGLLYKEVADRLNLSFETIRSHVKRIYEKLHAHSRTEAILKYRGETA